MTDRAARHRVDFLLDRVAHQLRKTADAALLGDAGLSTAQAAALRLVVEDQGITARAIAQTLGQQESAVSTMMRRLEEAGFVERGPDPQDGRVRRIEATARGRAALASLLDAFEPVDAALDPVLDGTRIANLEATLRAMLTELRRQA